jgi:acetoin utilization protein AcuB
MERVEQKRRLIRTAVEPLPADQLSTLRVGQVMTASPLCVPVDRTALEIVELFHEMRFRHLLVTDQGRLVGVMSDRDVVRLFGSHDSPERDYLATITAGDLMSTDLLTIHPDAPLLSAVSLMLEHGIHCLPVVDEGYARGIMTGTDLLLTLEQVLNCLATDCTAA